METSNNVNQWKQEDPDQVHEVPIQSAVLDPIRPTFIHLAEQDDTEQNHAHNHVNRVKAGQAIPVKFQIPETDDFERDLDTVTDLSLTEINCEDMTEAAPAESLDLDARPGLRFDDDSGEYHYRWKSDRNHSGCYRLTLTLDDGSMHHAYFRFR